jgi:hypothetical protein
MVLLRRHSTISRVVIRNPERMKKRSTERYAPPAQV